MHPSTGTFDISVAASGSRSADAAGSMNIGVQTCCASLDRDLCYTSGSVWVSVCRGGRLGGPRCADSLCTLRQGPQIYRRQCLGLGVQRRQALSTSVCRLAVHAATETSDILAAVSGFRRAEASGFTTSRTAWRLAVHLSAASTGSSASAWVSVCRGVEDTSPCLGANS